MKKQTPPRAPTARMLRPNDARALRSREALKSGLLALIDQQAYDEITIRDITTQASVSYPVFFRRYASKDELLEDVAATEVRRLLELTVPVFETEPADESLSVLCRYVHEHRSLWARLLTGGAAKAMRAEFTKIAEEMGSNRERNNPWLPTDLAAAFVVNGLFEILSWWLRQPTNYPLENVAKLIEVLVVRSTAKPVDVNLIDFNSDHDQSGPASN